MAIVKVRKPAPLDIVEPGEYLVRIVKEHQKDGRLEFELEILDAERFRGRKLIFSAPTEGKGTFYLHKFIQTAMRDPNFESDEFDTYMLIGSTLYVAVEHDHYNGKTYPKVMDMRPDGGEPGTDAEDLPA